jgi:hypothetical protein
VLGEVADLFAELPGLRGPGVRRGEGRDLADAMDQGAHSVFERCAEDGVEGLDGAVELAEGQARLGLLQADHPFGAEVPE